MATMNLSLPDPLCDWVETQVKQGQYSSASDYVRDLISRDQQYQNRRETLSRALDVGEASGRSERTLADIWEAVKARHRGDL